VIFISDVHAADLNLLWRSEVSKPLGELRRLCLGVRKSDSQYQKN